MDISFKEAMRLIETGKVFSLRWVTCDRRRKKGGAIKMLDGLQLLIEAEEERQIGGEKTAPKRPVYSYHESKQYMNIWCAANGKHIRIYKRLMLVINGRKIIY